MPTRGLKIHLKTNNQVEIANLLSVDKRKKSIRSGCYIQFETFDLIAKIEKNCR